jgi:CRISPR-associated endonuclease/helicase Cas3
MPLDFDTFFRNATGNLPFPYQRQLATGESLPQLIDVPTGAGKTATAILGWLWRRRFANEETKQVTPRRLVYCLPMRVLVEQTVEAAERWLNNLSLQEEVHVYVLMGGEEAEDWDVYPERDAILIGTQDMLLSRALNRGYGMSRYRWPMHFGLLNNDCLWVLDEIQLMGSGLATTTQLQAFREKLNAWGPVQTVWMSATLRQDWLKTVDFKDKIASLSRLGISSEDREADQLRQRLEAKKPLAFAGVTAGDKPEEVAEIARIIKDQHPPGSFTLVVVNTVDRARTLYEDLRRRYQPAEGKKGKRRKESVEQTPSGDAQPDLLLLHSRFRPVERALRMDRLRSSVPEAGRIVIATQVIEAGVDISAKTLFTELAPWASLVQRFGRCNRFGEYADARVFWIDVPTDDKKNLAPPYENEELNAARIVLQDQALDDVGPDSLKAYLESVPAEERKKLFYYEPLHVIRRKDLIELFDTTPDLAGNDIDISRFIRDGQDLDVQVLWREVRDKSGPSPDDESGSAPHREELCSVPFYKFKEDFLKKAQKEAYRWDVLERQWLEVEMDAVFPGQVFLIPTDQGGYDPDTGWEPKSGLVIEPVPFTEPQPSESNDDDLPSYTQWQTIAGHSDDMVAEIESSAAALGLNSELQIAMQTAARWHDRGKAHPTFQAAIYDSRRPGEKERPESWRGKRDLAKAPPEFWRRGYDRTHFRHELATGLAMLQAGLPPLAVYLAAAHHGKVRLSIRSLPNEKRPDDPGMRFARGVWDDDSLPETDLGGGVIAPAVTLSLEPMELGLGQNGEPSWAERVLRLRNDPQLGLFTLAFLEAVVRAADWRASAKHNKRSA